MRTARPLAVLATLLTVGLSGGLLLAPSATAQPPFRLADYVTDTTGALSDSGHTKVTAAVTKLYTDRHIRLWVVYVDDFSGQTPTGWAQRTMRASDLGDYDALLAVATTGRAYAFLVPSTIKSVTASQVDDLRHNKIEPALHSGDWGGAAVAAADGLDASPGSSGRVILLATLAGILIALAGLLLVMRRRGRRRRAAALAAARARRPVSRAGGGRRQRATHQRQRTGAGGHRIRRTANPTIHPGRDQRQSGSVPGVHGAPTAGRRHSGDTGAAPRAAHPGSRLGGAGRPRARVTNRGVREVARSGDQRFLAA